MKWNIYGDAWREPVNIGNVKAVAVTFDTMGCWYVLPVLNSGADINKMPVLFNEEQIVRAGLGDQRIRESINSYYAKNGLNQNNFGPVVQKAIINSIYNDYNTAWIEARGSNLPIKQNAPINSISGIAYADKYRQALSTSQTVSGITQTQGSEIGRL